MDDEYEQIRLNLSNQAVITGTPTGFRQPHR